MEYAEIIKKILTNLHLLELVLKEQQIYITCAIKAISDGNISLSYFLPVSSKFRTKKPCLTLCICMKITQPSAK